MLSRLQLQEIKIYLKSKLDIVGHSWFNLDTDPPFPSKIQLDRDSL